MAQDTALLRYLLKGARRAPGSGSQRDLAFAFDGTNDYISSNATIGRTGYDMNVSGNVSTGSDADGSYIQFNGNRTAGTGTKANVGPTSTPTYTQTTSFSFKAKVKFNSLAVANTSGIFGADTDAAIYYDFTTNALRRVLRGSTTVGVGALSTTATSTIYDAYFVYDSTVAKFYCYLSTSGSASVLQNTGGTSGPATFTTSNWYLGDDGVGAGTAESCNKYIYHAAIRNKALTQAEIDADIALGNTAKNDPSIVAYYIPDNLTYNTQYMSNPKDLDNAIWTKSAGATVTANTTVAPDGTTTADTVSISGASGISVYQTNTSISGATIASKTFIVKAFVKCSAGTQTFRLECSQAGVASSKSADLTATTTRQEFTFSQAFTSSASGTGVTGAIVNSSTATNPTLEVRNVRLFLVNETLRDESPNIGGFIGWKTQKVLSCRYKPNADFADSPDAGCLISQPRAYLQDRGPLHNATIRYDSRLGARTSFTSLGSGYRAKTHILGLQYRTGSARSTKLYINGVLLDSDNHSVDAPTATVNTVLRSGRKGSTYFSGNIRDARIYTFTGSFTNADALAIYNGGEPTSSGVTKYLHYRPPVGEVGTTTQDQSTNDRDGTLNGGVTRDYI